MHRFVLLPVLFLALLLSTPAFAQDTSGAEPNMGNLFQNVTNIADTLKADLTDLEARIQESRDSIEKGSEVLDAMLASVSAVHDSMAEDSEIWKELDALMDLWEQRRKSALEKSETNPEFAKIADAWKTRISTAKDLRNQISTERANSLALMRAIESDRDIVLAYYELGQADKAIESMQKVSSDLTTLNENMQAIVETAGSVQNPISN